MKINHSQFVFAREYRGMNQKQLSEQINGLSQSNLSKFEKGLEIISNDIVKEIIRVLDFPFSFFYKTIYNEIESAHYRKKSGITKAVRVQIETNNKLLGYIVDELNKSIDFPEFSLKAFDVEEYTPESIAKHTRKIIGLKRQEAVSNIFSMLEKNGIIIVERDDFSEKFDGVSFKTDNGVPVIIINKNFPNDRKRFTLAHELGHILMHTGDFPIPEYRQGKEKENEANRFASEFLMPKDDIINSLRGLRLSDLAPLKKYWKTSKQSIIRRAKDLGCINENRWKYFMIEFSRSGERRVEKTLVDIDKPVIFKKAYELHRNSLNYTDSELAKAFSLSKNTIEKYFKDNEESKLKIVL